MNNLPQIKNQGQKFIIFKELEDIAKLEKPQSIFCGYVYAIEYGENLKIGYTQNPKQRVIALRGQAKLYADKNIGWMALSPPHTNFMENEKFLHQHFAEKRLSGELFSLTFKQFINQCPDLEFQDLSEEKSLLSRQSLELLKSFILGTTELIYSKGVINMPKQETVCCGCKGIIVSGEPVWVSDIGEENGIITHPLADCLRKYIQPVEATFVNETIIK